MNIFETLPTELQQRIFYYLSHPVADLIRRRVEELHVHETVEIFSDNTELIIEVDLRDIFYSEYFHAYEHFKIHKTFDNYDFISSVDILVALIGEETSSDESTESLE